MLAKELIDRLEQLGLLDQEIIEALREQIDQGGARVTPEAVAKLLVDNGQLTHFQATKLIGELRSGQYAPAEQSEPESSSDSEELGFADDDSLPDAVETEEPADALNEPEAEPVREAIPVATAVPLSPQIPDPPSTQPSQIPRRLPKQSVWDSFKVYGYVGIIATLLLTAFGLWFLVTRESAEEFVGKANSLYDQQDYQAAHELYEDFLRRYPDSQYESLARVRATMTELYLALQVSQDAARAVDLATQELPNISQESGLNDERGNLAGLLVDIADRVAVSASRADATDDKQALLNKLDEQFELIEDSTYVPSSMRATLASQIKRVRESRARVQRDIDRNLRLDASEATMKVSLQENRTKDAYDARKDLLREFPELHDHARLVSLIREASDIQQALVQNADRIPDVTTGSLDDPRPPTIVLKTLEGEPAAGLEGQTVYVRVGSSLMAFDGESGQFKWRRIVGREGETPAVSLPDEAGVLLTDSTNWELSRCDASAGDVQWTATIGERFAPPIVSDEDAYLTTQSGRLLSFDLESGAVQWGTQFPQELETGPGIDRQREIAYVAGDHSNLYAIDTANGNCVESYFVGHEEGTVRVPPVALLDHVFVIENAGTNYSKLHILSNDPEDERLHASQPFHRLTGNVRVAPVVQGRRLIVLTDRGEVTVFDIEPTADREKVTVAARLPPFYDQPTATQMAVGRGQMWITGTRLGHYELQINTGDVVRGWSLYEADTFIGKPLYLGSTLVHARVLRGTSAIRVTAAVPETGSEIWHTDVGVPVAMLHPIPDEPGFHAVTTQAALFDLDRESLETGVTKDPVENPGQRTVNIRYEDPIEIDQDRSVMLNHADGQSMAVYDPRRQRERIRLVTMRLSSALDANNAIAADGGILIPLSNGRVVLVDYRTGAMKASPFQPPTEPTARVKWTQPVSTPDDESLVVLADSRKRIYRIRVGDRLRELSSKEFPYELLGAATIVQGTWFAAVTEPSSDVVVGFDAQTLDESVQVSIGGRIQWGPVAVGDLFFVLSDDARLHAFDSQGQERFAVDIPRGLPAGDPVVIEDAMVLAGSPGWLVTIDLESGEVLGRDDVGEPISATPAPLGSRLLVPGGEGVVYVVDVPGR